MQGTHWSQGRASQKSTVRTRSAGHWTSDGSLDSGNSNRKSGTILIGEELEIKVFSLQYWPIVTGGITVKMIG